MNLLALNLSGSGELRGPVSGTGSLTLGGSFLVGDSASTSGVAYAGTVSVGSHTLTLRDADFASLGGETTLAGGTITAANGLTLPAGSTLSGFGTVAGSMWNAGTITATGGNLTIGSTTGTYFSDQSGVLNVGAEKVTLLGTSVTLGNSTTLAGGQLVAPSGFIYDPTRKVSGYGTIRTENLVGLDATMATPTGALTVGTNVAVGTDTLTFLSNAATVLNAALTVAGGRVTATGFGLAIGGTGSVSGFGTINQPVTNAGTINVTASQQLTINGLFANTGTVNPTGTLRLTAGGSLGGTFGAGSLALAGGTYALPSAWTIPTGLSVDLSGSTFAGPGNLQIGTGATLRVAGAGGTANTAVTNAGTLSLAGSLVGTGTMTNQGVLRAEEILSGGNPAFPFVGVHAAVGVATTNAASGTLQVSAGRALEFLSPVTNAGALEVGGTMRFGGALTHTGTATVAGTLDLRGGGTSSGAINLAGGSVVFNGLGETFTVANAATGLTGSGGLTFASGTTVLNYGVTAAPVTINQSLGFTGGTLELPGATSLRTSSLVLDRRYSEISGLVLSVGSTPDLPTTVLAGGTFGWGAGTVRNTLTLEAGGTPALVLSGDINLDGTLINRTTNLRFEAGFKTVTQSVVSSDAGGSTRFFTASLAEGSFGGTGTLRNEGTLAVDLSGLRGRTYDYTGASTSEFSGLNWTPGIENLGTATLGGKSAVGPSFATLTSGGTFTGPITNSGNLTLFGRIGLSNLTQTAGTTTLQNNPTVAGGAWSVGTGSTLTAPNGAYLSVNLTNSGTLDFGAGTTVGTLQNQAGGTVRFAGLLATQPAFLTGNAGTIILDGPAAGLRTIGTTVIDGKFLPGDSLALGSIAGGTLELRNGANAALDNGIGSAANLVVGNGSTLALTGGTLSRPGTIAILSSGVVNQTGGSLNRDVSIGGTFNWSGGSWSSGGTTMIGSGGTLVMSGSGSHDFIFRPIVNNGTVTWAGGALQSGAGGSVTNNGVFNDAASAVINTHGFYGGPFSFTNTGTYNKTAPGTTTVEIPFTNSGTMNVQAGTLRLAGGGSFSAAGALSVAAGATLAFASDYTIPDASRLTGGGTFLFTNTLNLSGNVNLPGFQMTAGKLAGSQTFNNAVLWNGADLSTGGTTTIGATGTMTMSGSNSHDFVFRTIVNNGTVNWTGGALQSGAGGIFTNNGTLNDSASASIFTAGFYGGPFSFSNTGTHNKTAPGTTTFEVPFTNTGTVNVQAGTLRLAGGGAFSGAGGASAAAGTTLVFASDYTIGDAARLGGAGHFLLSAGTLSLSGTLATPHFQQTGGRLAGTYTLAGTYDMNSTDWNFGGTTTIANSGVLNVTVGLDFLSRAIVNNGTVNWSGGNLQSGLGGSITNHGTFNDAASAALFASGYYGGSFTFTNTGTYNKTAAGTTDIQIPFTNTGTVNVQVGQLTISGIVSGGVLSGGTWRVADGARLALDGDTAVARNAATLVLTGANSLFNGLNSLTNNSGSLSLLGGRAFSTGAAFTNSGTLLVGSGSSFATSSTFTNSGTLNVLGTFAAGGGLTNLGTLAGAGAITGSLTSGGTLAPGNSPGLLAVSGNLTLLSTSQLVMELGGTVEGVSYDSIDVTGAITLAGALNVVLVNGFSPVSGASFNLIDAASFSGNFTAVNLPALPGGLVWNTAALTTAGLISVSGSAIPEPSTYAAIFGAVVLGLAWWRRNGRRE